MSDTAQYSPNLAPPVAPTDPALTPTANTPVTAADLNPPATPAALASDPAYNAFLRTINGQSALSQNQADEQTAFLRANLPGNLAEISRRGSQALGATQNAFSQRGTLASSWSNNAQNIDRINTAQGLAGATEAERNAETGINQTAAATQANLKETQAQEALLQGTALGSAPGTAGSAANAAASAQLVTPNAQAAGASTTGESVVIEAGKYVGGPYQWGGGHSGADVPPGGAVDCSGLVQQVYEDNGITIQGTAADMQRMGTPVASLATAQPGDLVFFGSPAHHVGIYIGNGQMISAANPASGVITSSVAGFGSDFSGVRRVIGTGPGGASTPGVAATAVATAPPVTVGGSPAVPAQGGYPGQPAIPGFQVPAALASDPAFNAYMVTMNKNEAIAGQDEASKIAALEAQYGAPGHFGQVQNQLVGRLTQPGGTLDAVANTQSQRGTLASSWANQALGDANAANRFAVNQATETGLGQQMAARQALEQTYAADQQNLANQALLTGQRLASNPVTAGTAANTATTPSLAGGSPIPVTPSPPEVSGWAKQAAQLAGVPSSWINGLVTIAMHESSGNPWAQNNSDSNAAAGHPSQGIMQLIPSVFAQYAVPGRTNINNPLDNMLASIGYIRARYGDINNVPGIKSLAAGGAYAPY